MDGAYAYIAGVLDVKGILGVYRHGYDNQRPTYFAHVSVSLRQSVIPELIRNTFGVGEWSRVAWRNRYEFRATGSDAEVVIAAVKPYLWLKRPHALVALELRTLQRDRERYITRMAGGVEGTAPFVVAEEYFRKCEELYQRCKRLSCKR